MHFVVKTEKARLQDLEFLLNQLPIESERNQGIRTYRVIVGRMAAPHFPDDAPIRALIGAAPGQTLMRPEEMLEIIARNAPGQDGLILDVRAADEHWQRLQVYWKVLNDRMKAEGYFGRVNEQPVQQTPGHRGNPGLDYETLMERLDAGQRVDEIKARERADEIKPRDRKTWKAIALTIGWPDTSPGGIKLLQDAHSRYKRASEDKDTLAALEEWRKKKGKK